MWLGLAGFAVIVLLMARRVNGAIMAGIMFTTFISWVPGHGASYLGAGADMAGGAERLDVFRKVVSLPDASKTSLTWNFSAFANSHLWIALVTFLYLDFLDATGTMCVRQQRALGFGVGGRALMWLRGLRRDSKRECWRPHPPAETPTPCPAVFVAPPNETGTRWRR